MCLLLQATCLLKLLFEVLIEMKSLLSRKNPETRSALMVVYLRALYKARISLTRQYSKIAEVTSQLSKHFILSLIPGKNNRLRLLHCCLQLKDYG